MEYFEHLPLPEHGQPSRFEIAIFTIVVYCNTGGVL